MNNVQLGEFLIEMRGMMEALREEQKEQTKKLALIAKRVWRASKKEKKV